MQIVRFTTSPDGEARVGRLTDGVIEHLPGIKSMGGLLAMPAEAIRAAVTATGGSLHPAAEVTLLPPVDGRTEVWASGVTYLRSRDARIEESDGADVYGRVYAADRPELFFKAPSWRVSTTGGTVGIRADSALNVPEPELAVVANSSGDIVGYLACNDMTSRSIEAENPLYLPQAKIYAGSCALSAGIVPAWEVADPGNLEIRLTVTEDGATVWSGTCTTANIVRRLDDLVGWLYAGDVFPEGAILATGTGVVPELEFTLRPGARIEVSIDEVGTIVSDVVVGTTAAPCNRSPRMNGLDETARLAV